MKIQELHRFSRLSLRGRQVANRVVVPAMASETADAQGLATQETIAHYKRLAQSGAGIVMVEYSFVQWSGRSERNQLGVDRDEQLPGLTAIACAIHEVGALTLLQLTHSGGKTTRDLTGGVLLGPSSVRVPAKDRELEEPAAMTAREIEEMKAAFICSALRACRAGFDGVELHSAHGYGLNQWLSGITNRREDSYGGSMRKRRRLLLEIVGAIRAVWPEGLLSVRIPGQDWIEGGLTIDDAQEVARELVSGGADLINVSSGLGGWRRPVERRGEGYLVKEAAAIQSAVEAPVIGVGGIESGEYIDSALQQGHLSLAAVGRAILHDPRAWRERVMRPRIEEPSAGMRA